MVQKEEIHPDGRKRERRGPRMCFRCVINCLDVTLMGLFH